LLEIASPLNSLGICLCEGKMIENETFWKRWDRTANDPTKFLGHAAIYWSKDRETKPQASPNEGNGTEKWPRTSQELAAIEHPNGDKAVTPYSLSFCMCHCFDGGEC
jgi:hypothetical protein